MAYEPEHNALAIEEQCDDSLQASILASPSSTPSPSHKAPLSMPSSSSLELKPPPNTLKYAFLEPNRTLSMILANDLNSNQETQVLGLLRENKAA